ncbi:MAG: polysulfide reductase NrfD, partial [Candidatus Eremiobacteraeota bacterium]|nr:polysulfide reductase NrfD [Candidatus Eremiobacteraeota bacterium]
MAEHFVQPPGWGWWIAFYFFFAGIAGASYALATMLRIWGAPRDEGTARIAYLLAFPLAVVCGILLTIDLGQPLRFWHMMINTTPGQFGELNFKPWSPISMGTWALLVFSAFAFIAFVEVWLKRNEAPPYSRPSAGAIAFNVVGSIFALFLALYTGVVLSVSNQPVWSDSYSIGGLFLASALSASAALLAWLSRYRRDDSAATQGRLLEADWYFVLLELIMLASFFMTLAVAGTLGHELSMPWILGWILVLASFIPPFMNVRGRRVALAGGGTVTTAVAHRADTVSTWIVIVGVLLMRILVIFSAQ